MEDKDIFIIFRCRKCEQRLYEGQKVCPVCKRSLISTKIYESAKDKKFIEAIKNFITRHPLDEGPSFVASNRNGSPAEDADITLTVKIVAKNI